MLVAVVANDRVQHCAISLENTDDIVEIGPRRNFHKTRNGRHKTEPLAADCLARTVRRGAGKHGCPVVIGEAICAKLELFCFCAKVVALAVAPDFHVVDAGPPAPIVCRPNSQKRRASAGYGTAKGRA